MAATENMTGTRAARLAEAKRALLQKRLKQAQQRDAGDRMTTQPSPNPAPLSYMQQRVWFLQRLFPESTAYNIFEAWLLSGSLQPDALETALNSVAARQTSLWTRFVEREGEVLQVVESVRLVIERVDLRRLSPETREAELIQLAESSANHRFDLEAAPPVRLVAVQLEEHSFALLLTIHHIISDEWSMDLLWRELDAAYVAALEKRSPSLPDLPIGYQDYARGQRQAITSDVQQSQRRYWEEQLAGLSGPLMLPADHPRPATPSLQGGLIKIALPDEIRVGIHDLSGRTGATPFMIFITAFQVLLSRYSNEQDIAVGTPIANRGRTETANVIGMFINTVVIRSDISGNFSFAELLVQVRKTVLAALNNQEYPFDLLVRSLAPERDLSVNPLFQSMFVYANEPDVRSLTGLQMKRLDIPRTVAKFDLTLFVGEEAGRLTAGLEYSTDLFTQRTAARILAHWESLLRAILHAPDQPVETLSLLSETERNEIMRASHGARLPLPVTEPVHRLIARQAAARPSTDAVVAASGRLTYGDLAAQSDRIARRLIDLGLTPGAPVGLYLERSPEMIVGILGVLKAGGAYVPLEPAYPTGRVAYVLKDTETPVVVTTSHLADRLSQFGVQTIIIDDKPVDSDGGSISLPTVSLDEAAYVIYTSGSTGLPKGVVVTHRTLVASTLARRDVYREPVGRYLLLSSYAFDSSVAGIFWTLVDGGTLVLPAPEEEKDVRRIAAMIQAEQVTHTLALPALYRLLLTYAPERALATLKTVIVAGEACPPDLGPIHHAALPGCNLFNEYGPTEATVWSTVYRVPLEPPAGSVPIGQPIPNTQAYVLDTRRNLAPIGVAGELYIAGEGVAQGYWRNASLTAERFVTIQPQGLPAPVRAYRTGDRVRLRADGQLEFHGRVDAQVKINGHRIEPGEIEAALLRHPPVDQAAVVAHEDGAPDSVGTRRSLVAYVVSAEHIDVSVLRELLTASLPEFLVPQQIVQLSALPRTPNGKLDRARLPVPVAGPDRVRAVVAPRTPAERVLAGIWSDLLNLPEVSVHDRFFELGGDSLMSIRVIARAQQEGLYLTPRQIFKEQTIARLAAVAGSAALGSASSDDFKSSAPALGPLPLTPIQSWFFAQDLPQPEHWNQAVWLEAEEAVDVDALSRAVGHLILRHDMLRAHFIRREDRWEQQLQPAAAPPPIRSFSLRDLVEDDQTERCREIADELHASMRLSPAPLLRIALIDLGANRPQRLLLVLHHLVVDAVSWGTITEDLTLAYGQIIRGEPVALAPVPTGYSDWSSALSSLARHGLPADEVEHWSSRAEIGSLVSHSGKTGVNETGVNTEGRSATIVVTLDNAHTRQLLRDAHRAYHTKVDDLLLTAFVRAYAAHTGERSVRLTLERHGREEIVPGLDCSQTVGWFTALFPVVLTLEETGDLGASIRAVKERLRAVPRNGVGYGILRYLGDEPIRAQLGDQPAPEILFNYLGQSLGAGSDDALLRPLAADIGAAYGTENRRAHLIDFNAAVVADRLVTGVQYAVDYFEEYAMKRLAELYLAELESLIAHCLASREYRHTPSDFPSAQLDQAEIDSLADLLDGLE